MPPLPVWYQGQAAIRTVYSYLLFSQGVPDPWRLRPIQANGQPGVAFYRFDAETRSYQPFVLQVLSFKHGLIADLTTFGYPQLFGRFGLPEVIET
jgi:RNA polymerase sigma-70 factor (ECF subfamily)